MLARVLSWLALLTRSNAAKDVELLVLPAVAPLGFSSAIRRRSHQKGPEGADLVGGYRRGRRGIPGSSAGSRRGVR